MADGVDVRFTKGWTKFTKELNLRVLNILVFTEIDEENFDVLVFGPNNVCEREAQKTLVGEEKLSKVTAKKKRRVEPGSSSVRGNQVLGNEAPRMSSVGDRQLKFKIPKGNCWRIPKHMYDIPGVFPGGEVPVVNNLGIEVKWGVMEDSGKKQPKYIVSGGWSSFMKLNDLKDGDVVEVVYKRRDARFYVTRVERSSGC